MRPGTAPEAAALDGQTLAGWLDTHLESKSARAILEVAVKAIFGTGSGELSLLFALFYLGAGGGLANLARTTGGAQESRFDGGSMQLASGHGGRAGGAGPARRARRGHLLRSRPPAGSADPAGRVAPAGHVTARARLVAAPHDPADRTAPYETLRVEARRAILALSPALCARLAYWPPLPADRDQLTQRMPMGAVIKVHAIYDTPFWRDEGLNGQVVAPGCAHGERLRQLTRGRRPRRPGRLRRRGRLPALRARAASEARRAEVLADLARAFGPRAARPVEYVEQDWCAEPFTRGGPVAVSSPGALTALGPGAAGAGRAAPLGGHGDRDQVVRVSRRGAQRGDPGGRRGPGRPGRTEPGPDRARRHGQHRRDPRGVRRMARPGPTTTRA